MTLRDIERVLYFESYVVVDPGMTPLERGPVIEQTTSILKRFEENQVTSLTKHAWVLKRFTNCYAPWICRFG